MFHAPASETKQHSDSTRPKMQPGYAPRRAPHPLAHLHSTYGNQAVLRMLSQSVPTIQTKLAVNKPGDEFEQEADRVADQVMRMTAPTHAIQRKCSSCAADEEKVQRKCPECEQEEKQTGLQRKESSVGPQFAPPSVGSVLNSLGRPLDAAARAFMEPRFGYDFSGVRVHDNAQAAESAKGVNALAYTVGNNVVFDSNQYQPGSNAGQRLLAHELAHVVQQNGSRLTSSPYRIARQAPPAPPAPPARAPLHWTPSINQVLLPFATAQPMVTEDQKLAIITLDTTTEGAWPNLDWGIVSACAAERIMDPTKINQKLLALCGPAAALNAEALQAPKSYAELVVNVFKTGKIGDKEVNPKLRNGTPFAGLEQCDWMLMSALQDVNNKAYSYYGNKQQESQRAYQTTDQVENDMKQTGCVATTTYPCYVFGEIDAATKASNLLAAHSTVIEVVIYLKSGPLQNPTFQKTAAGPGDTISKGSPNHFVRLTEAITFAPDAVTFKAFTWGAINQYTFSVSNFQTLVSAFVVGSRDKAIQL